MTVNGHELFDGTEENCPDEVKEWDAGVCKLCGAAEIELDEHCQGAREKRDNYKRELEALASYARENPDKLSKIKDCPTSAGMSKALEAACEKSWNTHCHFRQEVRVPNTSSIPPFSSLVSVPIEWSDTEAAEGDAYLLRAKAEWKERIIAALRAFADNISDDATRAAILAGIEQKP